MKSHKEDTANEKEKEEGREDDLPIQPPHTSPHPTLKRRLQQRRVRMRSIPPHCIQQPHPRVGRRGREGGRGGGREGGRELGAGGLALGGREGGEFLVEDALGLRREERREGGKKEGVVSKG